MSSSMSLNLKRLAKYRRIRGPVSQVTSQDIALRHPYPSSKRPQSAWWRGVHVHSEPVLVLVRRTTGLGEAPDTLEHVPGINTRSTPLHPNTPYLCYIRTDHVVTLGTIQSLRAVDEEHVEAVVLFRSSRNGSAPCGLVLFERTIIDSAYVRLSPAWRILRCWNPRWDAEAVAEAFDRPWSQLFLVNAQPVISWVDIRATSRCERLDTDTPSVWKFVDAPEALHVSVGIRFNLWDATDNSFGFSAEFVGVRAIEQGWLEFVCFIYRAQLYLEGTPFVQIVVPVARAHMPRRFRRQYLASWQRLPLIINRELDT